MPLLEPFLGYLVFVLLVVRNDEDEGAANAEERAGAGYKAAAGMEEEETGAGVKV